MARRYGYLDQPDGWSDVDDTRVLAQCVDCGRVLTCEGEATWVTDGERYTSCGCAELFEPWEEFQAELDLADELGLDIEDYLKAEDEGWEQADLEWASRCDDDNREPRLRDWTEL